MGQVILQGCQTNCQGVIVQRPRVRSHIYLNNLAAQLPAYQQEGDLRNSVNSQNLNGQFLQQIKHVSTEYIEFINHLFVNKTKFEDKVFPADSQSLLLKGMPNNDCQWARLTDITQQAAFVYKKFGGGNRSNVLHLLQTLQSFSGLDSYKPIYIEKVGLAICSLYINGQRQDVVVDDRIPTSHLKYYSPKKQWFFLIEKAFAKILGNYSFIDDFSLPELFQEITGLPYVLQQRDQQNYRDSCLGSSISAEMHSFQDAIQNDDPCYLPCEKEGEVCCMRFLKGFTVKSLPVNAVSQIPALFKMKVDRAGKISLRLSFLNSKYQAEKRAKLGQWTIQLFRQQGDQYHLVQDKTSVIENTIYLGSIFIRLMTGRFLLYLRSSAHSPKTNLVYYAGDGAVSITQLQPGQACRFILQKIESKSP